MRKFTKFAALAAAMMCSVSAYSEYTLVWADEFNCQTLNTTAWSYETGTGGEGWGNQEKQYYTTSSNNLYFEDGHMVIKAIRDDNQYNPSYATHFTSARIKTQGKVSVKYGKIEARLKMPQSARGVWPAFWMLGENGSWPNCGEVDIMEYMCQDTNNKTMLSTIHYYDPNGEWGMHGSYGGGLNISNPQDWHVYSVEWTPEIMIFRVDNSEIIRMDMRTSVYPRMEPFHAEQYLLLNLAMGGTYVGGGFDESIQSAYYLIDYVRIYQDRATYSASSLTNRSTDQSCGEPEPSTECYLIPSVQKEKAYFNPGWGGESNNYVYTLNGSNAYIKLNEATTQQWQAQFWMKAPSTLALNDGTSYKFSMDIHSTKAIGTVTAKLVQRGNDGLFLFSKEFSLPANSTQHFTYTGSAPGGMTDCLLVLDFGGESPAGNEIYVDNIALNNANCLPTEVEEAVVEENLSVWPSPTTGVVNVESASEISVINVYSMFGALLQSQEIDAEAGSVDLTGYNKGLYILEVENASGKNTVKIKKD